MILWPCFSHLSVVGFQELTIQPSSSEYTLIFQSYSYNIKHIIEAFLQISLIWKGPHQTVSSYWAWEQLKPRVSLTWIISWSWLPTSGLLYPAIFLMRIYGSGLNFYISHRDLVIIKYIIIWNHQKLWNKALSKHKIFPHLNTHRLYTDKEGVCVSKCILWFLFLVFWSLTA